MVVELSHSCVVRGGSWANNPDNCRSTYRNRNAPANRDNNIGFRVCFRLHVRAGSLASTPRTAGFGPGWRGAVVVLIQVPSRRGVTLAVAEKPRPGPSGRGNPKAVPGRFHSGGTVAKELKVIADCYAFALYVSQRVEKFPRSHRYTLGAEIERGAQAVLGLLGTRPVDHVIDG